MNLNSLKDNYYNNSVSNNRRNKLVMLYLGKNIIHYNKIDSTQLEVWRRIEEQNIENGTIIIADMQLEGKRNSWKKMVYY